MVNLITKNARYAESGIPGFGKNMVAGGGYTPIEGDGFLDTLNFTVEMFITPDPDRSGTEVFFTKSGCFMMVNGASGIRLTYGNVNLYGSLTRGVRQHIRLVLGDNGCKLFIDGELEASSSKTPTSAGMSLPEIPYLIFGLGYSNVGTSSPYYGEMSEIAVFDYEKTDESFTIPTEQYVGDETGLVGYFKLDGNGINSVGNDDVIIQPNNSNILYSPYTWELGDSGAKTINLGAYLKFKAASEKCTLYFELPNRTPYPVIALRIDGHTIQRIAVDSEVEVEFPAISNDENEHFIEIFSDSQIQSGERWAAEDTPLKLHAIALSSGGTIIKPVEKATKLLALGDSITAGVASLSATNEDTVARSSALGCHPLKVADLCNAEIGCIGLGGTGVSKDNYTTPKVGNSYQWLFEGVARDLSDAPDVCWWLLGANDANDNIVEDGLAAINSMLVTMPTTKFIIFRALDGSQAANLQTIAETCDEPHRVTYVSTAGFDPSGQLHPYAYTHLANVAPKIAEVVNKMLEKGYVGTESSATIKVSGIPDGTYRTSLSSSGGRTVFDGDLTYASETAIATGLGTYAADDLTGFIVDSTTDTTKGAIVSVVAS